MYVKLVDKASDANHPREYMNNPVPLQAGSNHPAFEWLLQLVARIAHLKAGKGQ
jgi:hypothetical protein